MKTVEFSGRTMELKKTKYSMSDTLALILVVPGTEEVECVVTTNIGTSGEGASTAVVKTYSENEGIMSALEAAGVVKKVVRKVRFGYVTCPLVEFDLEDVEEV